MNAYLEMWERAFDFKGRTGPDKFKYAYIVNLVIIIIQYLTLSVVINHETVWIGGMFSLIFMLYDFMMLIPFISLQIRRFHDAGKTTGRFWLCLLTAPLFVGLVAMFIIFRQGSDKPNRWGPIPDDGDEVRYPDTNVPEQAVDSFVDQYITEADIPAKKRWPKNILILFLISILFYILFMAFMSLY